MHKDQRFQLNSSLINRQDAGVSERFDDKYVTGWNFQAVFYLSEELTFTGCIRLYRQIEHTNPFNTLWCLWSCCIFVLRWDSEMCNFCVLTHKDGSTEYAGLLHHAQWVLSEIGLHFLGCCTNGLSALKQLFDKMVFLHVSDEILSQIRTYQRRAIKCDITTHFNAADQKKNCISRCNLVQQLSNKCLCETET